MGLDLFSRQVLVPYPSAASRQQTSWGEGFIHELTDDTRMTVSVQGSVLVYNVSA